VATEPAHIENSDASELRAKLLDQEVKFEKLLKQYEILAEEKRKSDLILNRVFASTSWRITKPVRSLGAIKRFCSPLFRNRAVYPVLEASEDVSQKGESFFVTGPKPVLELQFGRESPPSGWCMLSTQFHSPSQHGFFTLFTNRGRGYGEDPGHLVTLHAGTNEVLLHLGEDVQSIRLAPFGGDSTFGLTRLHIREVGKSTVGVHLLKKQLAPLALKPSLLFSKLGKGVAILRAGGFEALRVKLFANQYTANYQEWIEKYDTLRAEDLRRMKSRLSQFAYQPKISIVMPVYNTGAEWLRAAIDSVLAQVYENWELCIADDASTQPHVRAILDAYAKRDTRIRVVYREQNGHIAAASNTALRLATGEFIALLDHDDELREHALYMMVEELNRFPEASLLYSDEDKKTSYGLRANPYFKCAWNPELFLQQNYICHLGMYRAAIVERIGGFREGFEGSQDWDLALRVVEQIPEDQIRHIPHVLYHWRQIEGSTAASSGAKPYALLAGKRAIEEHLSRRGRPAEVEILPEIAHYRVRYPLPAAPPLVSLIIPTRDQVAVLSQCIESILRHTTYTNFEIVIVDNNSSEKETARYFAAITEDRRVRVVPDARPFNFSLINNFALRQSLLFSITIWRLSRATGSQR